MIRNIIIAFQAAYLKISIDSIIHELLPNKYRSGNTSKYNYNQDNVYDDSSEESK